MVDITTKVNTHRKAIATAKVIFSQAQTALLIRDKKIPKGDVFEMSKAAGLLAVKKTSDVIPDCHPLPIEFTRISHHLNEMDLLVEVEVHTLYKTGVEVEAMYGASVVAMTLYDMLKPVDKGIRIENIALKEKEGGKTDFRNDNGLGLNASIVLVSDSIHSGKKEDTAGQIVLNKLKKFSLSNINYTILPDDIAQLQQKVKDDAQNNNLIIICGGTGFTKKDKTPEAILPMLDCEIPGIMEWARNYGQQRTPYSMFSRGFAGLIGKTLVIAIPGSSNGAKESMDALFPYVLHGFNMLREK